MACEIIAAETLDDETWARIAAMDPDARSEDVNDLVSQYLNLRTCVAIPNGQYVEVVTDAECSWWYDSPSDDSREHFEAHQAWIADVHDSRCRLVELTGYRDVRVKDIDWSDEWDAVPDTCRAIVAAIEAGAEPILT